MSSSRPLITACPIPAEASTTTDSVETVRMTQRGFPRGFPRGGAADAAGRGPSRAGRGGRCGAGRGLGDRGGVGKGGHLRTTAVRGIVSTVGRYDLRPGASPPARASVSPVRGNVSPL
ncbi:hypothetical protein GCM10010415_00050 [Streptomyces atrovirens]